MWCSYVGLFILGVLAWFDNKKQKDQSTRHMTNHKRTRELNFTEILIWLVILSELLGSHGKITSSAAIKKIFLALITEESLKKLLNTHTVYCVYIHCVHTNTKEIKRLKVHLIQIS